MTLLTTVQAAAQELGIRSPTAVAGASNATATRLWQIARSAARDLLEAHAWSRLVKLATITSTGAATYSLPSDFHRMSGSSMWNSTDQWQVRGHDYPARWQARVQGGVLTTHINAAFRLTNNTSGDRLIEFQPAPDSGDSLTYQYVSDAMFDSGAGLVADWTADGYTSLLDERLIRKGIIWRMLRSIGREYQDQQAEYMLDLRRAIAQDTPSPALLLGLESGYEPSVSIDA